MLITTVEKELWPTISKGFCYPSVSFFKPNDFLVALDIKQKCFDAYHGMRH